MKEAWPAQIAPAQAAPAQIASAQIALAQIAPAQAANASSAQEWPSKRTSPLPFGPSTCWRGAAPEALEVVGRLVQKASRLANP